MFKGKSKQKDGEINREELMIKNTAILRVLTCLLFAFVLLGCVVSSGRIKAASMSTRAVQGESAVPGNGGNFVSGKTASVQYTAKAERGK